MNFPINGKVYIFDRYGKLIKDLDPKGTGWNGNFLEDNATIRLLVQSFS